MSLSADHDERVGGGVEPERGGEERPAYSTLLWWLLAMGGLAAAGYAIYTATVGDDGDTAQQASAEQRVLPTVDEPTQSMVLPEAIPDQPVDLSEAPDADTALLVTRPTADDPVLSGSPQNTAAGSGTNERVREQLNRLSGHARMASLSGVRNLPATFALLVDNIQRGRLPRKHFKFMAPEGKFIAEERASGDYVMDPKSYRRYDYIATILASLDGDTVKRVYARLKPVLQSAYENLGYPDRNFDQALFAAIDRILATPVTSGEVRLIRPSVMYKYADPRLESLNSVQKQLIRMGPKNTRIIQDKLRQVKTWLRTTP